MSSGALLLSANPAQDHRVLTPGSHYLERPPMVEAFALPCSSWPTIPSGRERSPRRGQIG